MIYGIVIKWLNVMKTKIKFNKNPKDYDLTVIVTPIWAGTLPPASRTYLDNDFNSIALASVSRSAIAKKIGAPTALLKPYIRGEKK